VTNSSCSSTSQKKRDQRRGIWTYYIDIKLHFNVVTKHLITFLTQRKRERQTWDKQGHSWTSASPLAKSLRSVLLHKAAMLLKKICFLILLMRLGTFSTLDKEENSTHTRAQLTVPKKNVDEIDCANKTKQPTKQTKQNNQLTNEGSNI
jgi:hypothetical protein